MNLYKDVKDVLFLTALVIFWSPLIVYNLLRKHLYNKGNDEP